MNAKWLFGMLVAVAVFFGATALLQSHRGETHRGPEGAFLPELKKNVNDVRKMTVHVGEEAMTFARQANGSWTMPERSDYPADRKKLDSLVLALAQAERLEPKTKLPSRYSSLGLDPEVEDSPPARVELFDGQGTSLAALWVGKRRPATTQESYFVRQESDPTCWLVSGNLRVESKSTQWLEATLTDVASQEVQAVRIAHPDGEQILLAKEANAADSAPLQIVNLPEGKEPQSEYVTSRFAAALQSLRLEDVLPADEVAMPADEVVTSEFWTQDGVHVTVRTLEQDGKVYAQLLADTEISGAPKVFAGPADPGGLPNVLDPDALGAEGEHETAAEVDPQVAQAAAQEIQERAQGWIYVLPSWKASALRGRMDELLKKEDLPDPMDAMGPNPTGEATLLQNVEVSPLDPEGTGGGLEAPNATEPGLPGTEPADTPPGDGSMPESNPEDTPKANPEAPKPQAPPPADAKDQNPDGKPSATPKDTKPPVFEIDPDAVKETGKGDSPAPAPSKKENGKDGGSDAGSGGTKESA